MKKGIIAKRTQLLKKKIKVMYYAMKDSRTPWYAKVIGVLTVAYAISPIDLIPDFIPVLGLLDDFVIVPAGIYLTYILIPEEVLKSAKYKAGKVSYTPMVSGAFGIFLIVSIWIILALLLISAFI